MKTVLNRKVVDPMSQPLFLGEDLSLQRYDRVRHQVFMDLFNKQLQNFWRPEEIELKKDRNDFNNLAKHEQFIFTSNLKFQTMLDSVISRGVITLLPYVSSTELEACFNVWQMFETIHSYAYSYIIQNVYSEPSKVFDDILKDKEILCRANTAVEAYDNLMYHDDKRFSLKDQIFLTLVSINILEAVRFYVSFVCAFAFGENKTMVGNADIIKLIKRDEACITQTHQVLTPNGWKYIDAIDTNTQIAQYNEDGTIEFVYPNKVIVKENNNKPLINYKNKNGNIDMMVTPDHRIIYHYKNNPNDIRESQAQDFKPNVFKSIPVCGKLKTNNNNSLTDYERFLIAVQADGTIRKSHTNQVTFYLKKERKINRLTKLLNRLRYKYTVTPNEEKGGFTFYVYCPKKTYKYFKDWVEPFNNLSYQWCVEFVDELVRWDGHIRTDTNALYYSSTVESNVIIAETIAMLSGYKCHKYIQTDDRKDTYKDVHRLSINTNKTSQSAQSLEKTIVTDHDHDYVYCVNVPSGMFVVKNNGGIFVTGNCHVSITQNLINTFRNDPSQGFTETIKNLDAEVYNMFSEAVEEEIKWAKYLFKDGSLLGLNEQILEMYIKYLADTRLASIGYDKIYKVKNPIGGWLDHWMNSHGEQVAPQESEIIQYKISASKNDLEGAFDDFEV